MISTIKKIAKKLSACKKSKTLSDLIERDGLLCHYCGYQLTNPNDILVKYRYGRPIQGRVIQWISPVTVWWGEFDETVVFPLHIRLPTIDHKLPPKQGGTHELDNLVLACYVCNFRKGKKSYKEFKESMRR